MNTNKKGFTLIELLVVIVIIGILATISVATFGGYFKKARDSERQSAVQNIATIVKVRNATDESVNYGAFDNNADGDKSDADEVIDDRDALDAALAGQGYSTPDSKNQYCYYYGFLTDSPNDEFFVAVGSEENEGSASSEFIAGTPDGITAGSAGTYAANTTTDICNNVATANYTVINW
jgi:prepilin-type N-terminal cleavage/methylation domain-containing protein